MAEPGTLAAEIAEIPARIAAALGESTAIETAAAAVRRFQPRSLVTVARGSSDAVADIVGRAAAEALGLIPASLPPSLVTLARAPLNFKGALVLAVSQSGASPDLAEAVRAARAGGALTVAIVNRPGSSLAEAATHVIPAGAGEERSVAATKSVALSLLAGLRLITRIAGQADSAAVHRLPQAIARIRTLELSAAAAALDAPALFVIGRGAGLGLAREGALKLKELAGQFAEALSGAEIMHGPKALLGPQVPLLAIVPNDASAPAMHAALAELASLSSRLVAIGAGVPPGPWQSHASAFADLGPFEPVALASVLAPLAVHLARRRGHNPDRPIHIAKITRTF